jgi:hypothetical protein
VGAEVGMETIEIVSTEMSPVYEDPLMLVKTT